MPNKTEEYLALAQRTANGLTRYWEIPAVQVQLCRPAHDLRPAA